MDLITLIKNNKCEFRSKCLIYTDDTDEIILNNIIELNCSGFILNQLPNLPNCISLMCNFCSLSVLHDLPKCKHLSCVSNRLTSLPNLPDCQTLDCSANDLISLPELHNCRDLLCSMNKLTRLPQLNNCTILSCSMNKLTRLPQLPNCTYLSCSYNKLPFEGLDKWKIVWKAKKLYLEKKYFSLWWKYMLQSKANKKAELHLELKWSPDLPFYKETEEYKHWLIAYGNFTQ